MKEEYIVDTFNDSEYIKNNINEMWEKYSDRIEWIINEVSGNKYWDRNDLLGLSYEYFVKCCRDYDPNYGGGNIPFLKYTYNNVRQNLYAYIQHHYKKNKYCSVGIEDLILRDTECNRTILKLVYLDNDIDDTEWIKHIINKINPKLLYVLEKKSMGITQQEIADELGINHFCIWQYISKFKKYLYKTYLTYKNGEKLNARMKLYLPLAIYWEEQILDYSNNKYIKSYNSNIKKAK